MFNRLGAGHFKGEKTGLGFKVGMFVKALGLFDSWDDHLDLRSLSCQIREIHPCKLSAPDLADV
jgi:hypothetical protein